MVFRQGDKVVHPNHGAGVVRELCRMNGTGQESEYYIIELFANRLTVMVPVANATSLGLRQASADLVREALATLAGRPEELPNDFKLRQKELTEKLRSGDTRLIAQVCRDLTWRSRWGQLTSTDARLLDHARSFLATELAAVRDCSTEEALAELSSVLVQTVSAWAAAPGAGH